MAISETLLKARLCALMGDFKFLPKHWSVKMVDVGLSHIKYNFYLSLSAQDTNILVLSFFETNEVSNLATTVTIVYDGPWVKDFADLCGAELDRRAKDAKALMGSRIEAYNNLKKGNF